MRGQNAGFLLFDGANHGFKRLGHLRRGMNSLERDKLNADPELPAVDFRLNALLERLGNARLAVAHQLKQVA